MKETIDFRFGDKVSQKETLKSDKFNLVLNVIAQNIALNGVDKNGYTTIHSSTFKNLYSRYTTYLDYLITSGYVERDYYDVDKQKPFGYRFSEMYKEQLVIAKIKCGYGKPKKKNKYKLADNTIIISDEINDRLKSDFKGCRLDYNLKQAQLAKTKDEWGNFIDIGKWINNNIKMQKWVNGELTYSWKSNRLYTNFTSLSSVIRLNNVQLNNEPVVEFDIRNSFPLMLAKYCIQQNPKIIEDYDFKCFCDAVLNGKFYTELQRKLNSVRNCDTQGNEDDLDARLLGKPETKKLFQVYLNGRRKRNRYINGVEVYLLPIMETNYTAVNDVVDRVKDNKEKMYLKLVEIETQFVLDVIAELYQQFPDIKILTCHDAIYVPESFKSRVKQIWDKYLADFTDDIPKVEDDEDLDLSDFGICDLDDDEELKTKRNPNEIDWDNWDSI